MLDVRRSSSVAHDSRSVTTVSASVITFDWLGIAVAVDCVAVAVVCVGGGWEHSWDDCRWTTLLAADRTPWDCEAGRTSPSDDPTTCLISDSRARHLAAEELTAKTSHYPLFSQTLLHHVQITHCNSVCNVGRLSAHTAENLVQYFCTILQHVP